MRLILASLVILGLWAAQPVLAQQPMAEEHYSHLPEVQTQGLVIENGIVWESSGGYGQSFVVKWELATGKVLRRVDLTPQLYAQGLTKFGDRLFLLTWKAGIAYELDADTLTVLREHQYEGDGWGLTNNGTQLIMSNGSDLLLFRNPETFAIEYQYRVRLVDTSLYGLNELEWVEGSIYANVLDTDMIVQIDEVNGRVERRIRLVSVINSQQGQRGQRKPGQANGIAYDKERGELLYTGKYWPFLYKLQ